MPRVVVPLTPTQINAAKPRQLRYRLHDGGGLMLEISPSGSKRWMLRYMLNGKHSYAALKNPFGVNDYPLVSLAEARKLAEAMRKDLAAGKDPSRAKALAKEMSEKVEKGRFRFVAERWHEERSRQWSEATTRKARLVLDVYLSPRLAEIPLAELSTAQVKPVLVDMAGKAPALARKARQYVSQIVEYAIQEGLRDDGRLLMLKGVLPRTERGHYPAVTSDRDLPALIRGISQVASLETRTALWLCMYTAVRPGVAVCAKWQDFDLERGEWHIPPEDMKQRFAHITPLPRQMVDRLRELQELFGGKGCLFPPMAGRRKTLTKKDSSDPTPPSEHMHRDTLSAALRDAGLRGVAVTHGMRATLRTIGRERLLIPDAVLEAQLAHAKKGEVAAAYDRTQLLVERHKAIQDWADYLDSILNSAA